MPQVVSLCKRILNPLICFLCVGDLFNSSFRTPLVFSPEHPQLFSEFNPNCASIVSATSALWPNLVAVRLIQGHTLIPSTCKLLSKHRKDTTNQRENRLKYIKQKSKAQTASSPTNRFVITQYQFHSPTERGTKQVD